MSISIYKVEYECDCGVNYGDCGAKCAVILKSNNSCDIYTLYHTDSHTYRGNINPTTIQVGLDCFGDAYLKALNRCINLKDSNANTLTDGERAVVFNWM